VPFPVDLNPEATHVGSLLQRNVRGHKVLYCFSEEDGSDTNVKLDAMLFVVTELINQTHMPPIEQIELYDKFILFRHPNLTKIYSYEVP
jgi:hypothetical protein